MDNEIYEEEIEEILNEKILKMNESLNSYNNLLQVLYHQHNQQNNDITAEILVYNNNIKKILWEVEMGNSLIDETKDKEITKYESVNTNIAILFEKIINNENEMDLITYIEENINIIDSKINREKITYPFFNYNEKEKNYIIKVLNNIYDISKRNNFEQQAVLIKEIDGTENEKNSKRITNLSSKKQINNFGKEINNALKLLEDNRKNFVKLFEQNYTINKIFLLLTILETEIHEQELKENMELKLQSMESKISNFYENMSKRESELLKKFEDKESNMLNNYLKRESELIKKLEDKESNMLNNYLKRESELIKKLEDKESNMLNNYLKRENKIFDGLEEKIEQQVKINLTWAKMFGTKSTLLIMALVLFFVIIIKFM